MITATLTSRLWRKHPFPVPAADDIEPRLRKQLALYCKGLGVDLPVSAALTAASCQRSCS